MNTWYDFYKDRINSSYQQYFEERYKPMLDIIRKINPAYLLEEGIGIGSISKALSEDISLRFGYDNSILILDLCFKNNVYVHTGLGNILEGLNKVKWKTAAILNTIDICFKKENISHALCVTHGVLEHFPDSDIEKIFARYKEQNIRNIHYVPLDKYHTQSFGDERLLPYQYWLDLVKPKDYLLFNDDHDLLLINT